MNDLDGRIKFHVAVIIQHSHGGLQIHELIGIHPADLFVCGLLLNDQLVKFLGSQML